MSSIASAFSSAEGEMLKMLMAAWLNVHIPGLSSNTGTVGFLQNSLSWYVGAAAVLGLLIAAGRLAIERKADAAKDAATGLVTTMITATAGVAVITALSKAGDSFSTWIVDQAASSAHQTPVQALDHLGAFTGVAAFSPGLVILLAVFAVIGMVVQLAMLLIRSALLVVLAGVWPLAAAASMTETGKGWYKKINGWIIAFLLFKPVAAIVYAAAIRLMLAARGEVATMEGIILVILASLVLPSLMKFIVPAVSAVGSMGAGEVIGAGIAVAAGAAMVVGSAGLGAGAMAAGAAAGGGGGGGGGGEPPPSPPGGGGGGEPPPSPPGGGGGGGEPAPAGGSGGSSGVSSGVGISQLVSAMHGGGGAVVEGQPSSTDSAAQGAMV